MIDERGLLLPGVHDVTLDDVQQRFGGFQKSDRRMTLFAKLREYLDAVKQAECGESVILDGSFVMACVDEPEDIDLILVLPAGWDRTAELRPYQYNLVSKRVVKRVYGLDVFTVTTDSIQVTEWITFFSGVNTKWREKFGWPDNIQKGILRVAL